MPKVRCDCCGSDVGLKDGQYIEAIHEFICQYCLEEMYAGGPEDMYSYEVH